MMASGGGESEASLDTTPVTSPATTIEAVTPTTAVIAATPEIAAWVEGEPRPLIGDTPAEILEAYEYNMQQALLTRDFKYLESMGVDPSLDVDETAVLYNFVGALGSNLYYPPENEFETSARPGEQLPDTFNGTGVLDLIVRQDVVAFDVGFNGYVEGVSDVQLTFFANADGTWKLDRHNTLTIFQDIDVLRP